MGLNQLIKATDPDGDNRDMFELRVVLSGGGNGGRSGGGRDSAGEKSADIAVMHRSQFFIDAARRIYFEPASSFQGDENDLESTATPYLAAKVSGASFCARAAKSPQPMPTAGNTSTNTTDFANASNSGDDHANVDTSDNAECDSSIKGAYWKKAGMTERWIINI